jgi:hypothetical protein
MPKPTGLAFNPEFLINSSSPLRAELPLIKKLWDALGTIFPEVPDDPAHWNLTVEQPLKALNYCCIKVLLDQPSDLTVQLNVFPARETDLSVYGINQRGGVPNQPGLTTARLHKRHWDSKKGFQNEILASADLRNDDWMEFVGWLSVARDQYLQETKPTVYRTAKAMTLTLASTYTPVSPIREMGGNKVVANVPGVPINNQWHVGSGVTLEVQRDPRGVRVRPQGTIPDVGWEYLESATADQELGQAIKNGWLLLAPTDPFRVVVKKMTRLRLGPPNVGIEVPYGAGTILEVSHDLQYVRVHQTDNTDGFSGWMMLEDIGPAMITKLLNNGQLRKVPT